MTRNLIREAARLTSRAPTSTRSRRTPLPHRHQPPQTTTTTRAASLRPPHLSPRLSISHLHLVPLSTRPTVFSSSFSSSSIVAKEKAASVSEDDSLVLQVPADGQGVTAQQLLQESKHPSPSTFLAARTSSRQLLSLNEPIPDGTSSLTFLTFNSSDDGGRRAFWLSSAYLLRLALLAEHTSALRLAGAVGTSSQMGGEAGFSAQYLVAPPSRDPTPPSTIEPSPLQQSISLLSELDAPASPLKEDQLAALEKTMGKLAQQKLSFTLREVSLDEARKMFELNPFKLEELEANYGSQQQRVRIVEIGELIDLAPAGSGANDFALLPTTKPIKAVKLLSCSTATWKPVKATSERLPSIQALLYLRGISFPTPAALKSYLSSKSDAEARDHRNIGAAQQLFFTHDSSPGTPFILPRGMRVVRKVERVVRDLYDVWGYDEVLTPQLYKPELWKRSGHWDNYRKDMFGVKGYHDADGTELAEVVPLPISMPEGRDEDGCCAHGNRGKDDSQTQMHKEDPDKGSFGLKPMNCPGHCLIFNSQERSYRDLPIRYAEFSPLHRNESSGSLSGLTRVRRFHQDDAHVFCRPDQVSSEISSMLSMLSSAYDTFGFQSFELVLSTRPPSFIGSIEEWDRAEDALKEALEASQRKWSLNEEDGAFYGPKIDVRLVDAAGRRHQTATIQLDFQLPQRFGLKYAQPGAEGDQVGSGGQASAASERLAAGYARPVMIHRAILGSVERFMAILIEQTMGRWPFWLSPRQAILLPSSSSSPELLSYAKRVRNQLALGMEFETQLHGPISDGKDQEGRSRQGMLTARPRARPSHTFHIDLDGSEETLGKRVRRAQMSRFNFILVVGEKEMMEGTVSVRAREESEGEGDEASTTPAEGRPRLSKDMGTWKVRELRELFVRMDSNHW